MKRITTTTATTTTTTTTTTKQPKIRNHRLWHAFWLLLLYAAFRLLVMERPFEPVPTIALRQRNEFQNNSNSNLTTTTTTTCSPIWQQTSALALWTQHIDRIFHASRLPNDSHFVLRNKVTELLRLVTPRLLLGQSTITRHWSTLEQLHNKWQRGDDISIVVLGGSVTMGVNCFTVKAQVRNCAWPYRLEQFLQQLGGERVRVYNLAIAGSNTATGTALLSLLPGSIPPPDIIINAYSTNDMHVQTVLQAQASNRTLQQLVFDMSQDFVRAALTRNEDCTHNPPPLLIWLDDYLGNEQPQIMATTPLTQSIHVLAHYYGFSFVSYANVARDLVYADTHESVFSPGKWYASPTATNMQREIHPSQSMHMVTAWLVAYHFLLLATQTCTLHSWHVSDYERTLQYDPSPGLPPLELDEATFARWPRMPRPVPTGLPPLLTPELTLEQVTELWRAKNTNAASLSGASCSTTTTTKTPKCPFVWVSGISLLQHRPSSSSSPKAEYRAIQSLFQKVLGPQQTPSWTLTDDTKRGDKLGWMPDQLGARMVFPLLPAATNTGRIKITLFYLKSYGQKWEHSTVQVTLESSSTTAERPHTFALTGFHDKKTSEMYIHSVEPGFYSQMTLELVHGTTFKLMGVAICGD